MRPVVVGFARHPYFLWLAASVGYSLLAVVGTAPMFSVAQSFLFLLGMMRIDNLTVLDFELNLAEACF